VITSGNFASDAYCAFFLLSLSCIQSLLISYSIPNISRVYGINLTGRARLCVRCSWGAADLVNMSLLSTVSHQLFPSANTNQRSRMKDRNQFEQGYTPFRAIERKKQNRLEEQIYKPQAILFASMRTTLPAIYHDIHRPTA
jgi:hypothetical protein